MVEKSARRSKDSRRELKEVRERFAAIVNVEDEIARVRSAGEREFEAAQRAKADLDADIRTAGSQLDQLRGQYREKREIYDHLVSEMAIFDERLAFAEMGVYEPHFDYDDSETFKAAIVRFRAPAQVNRCTRFSIDKTSLSTSELQGRSDSLPAISLSSSAPFSHGFAFSGSPSAAILICTTLPFAHRA